MALVGDTVHCRSVVVSCKSRALKVPMLANGDASLEIRHAAQQRHARGTSTFAQPVTMTHGSQHKIMSRERGVVILSWHTDRDLHVRIIIT